MHNYYKFLCNHTFELPTFLFSLIIYLEILNDIYIYIYILSLYYMHIF